jgi:hypothetical protein
LDKNGDGAMAEATKSVLITTESNLVARIEAIYAERVAAAWDVLAASLANVPAVVSSHLVDLPPIYDPYHLLRGHHVNGWVTAHWAYDYYPGIGGLQHQVQFVGGRFEAHGTPASLPAVACHPARWRVGAWTVLPPLA